MTRRPLALVCVLALLLSACAGTAKPEGDEGWQVYFTAPFDPGEPDSLLGGSCLVSETRRVPPGEDLLNGLVECLLSGPISGELSTPFPKGVQQVEPPVIEDGVCRVNLSEQYGGLSGIDLTVADYCITLTLCQVPGVDGVTIDVEGAPIPYRDHQVLQASDVIFSSAEDEPVYLAAELYFLRRDGGLGMEDREILVSSGDIPAQVVLQALLDGPQNAGHYLPFPEEAHLIDLLVKDDGMCYIDFDAAFLEQAPTSPVEARLLLYAIVNTLCQLPSVDSVYLLVEGKSPEQYGGIPTTSPLEANLDLIAENTDS